MKQKTRIPKKEAEDPKIENIKDLMKPEQLNFDTGDTAVLPADGLLIKNDEDEVRMLFFYFKPGFSNDGKVDCKGTTEIRISRNTFLQMAETICDTIEDMQQEKIKSDKPIINQEIPMYG